MFLIGLTGGIAAGKSTVAKYWQSLGGIEIDADALSRQVVEKGTPGLKKVIDAFGASILLTDGSLDRAALGSRVFADAALKAKLESIIHPLVQAEAKHIMSQQPENSMIIYNVPLLVEADVQLPFNRVVTVEAPEAVRSQRLIDSRGLTMQAAKARIAAQATATERANRADYILNSNQDLALLLKDAGSLWRTMQKEAELGTH